MRPSKQSRPGADSPARAAGSRGRLLLVEPNDLTRWCLRTYLERWFTVEAVASSEGAAQRVGSGPLAALVLSDELPREESAALLKVLGHDGAPVTVVRMVTETSETTHADPRALQIEKPFELPSLARLLGITEGEISAN